MTKEQLLEIEKLTKNLLETIGEDSEREGLIKTPKRVARSWEFLTKGYHTEIEEVINEAVFDEGYDEMVTINNIDFYSICEHHLIPFFGKAHVAYIPNGKVVGLSKIPRIIEIFSRRLQLQERLTQQIANTLSDILSPRGVAVVLEAQHMCMQMRGVEKQNSHATTSFMTGLFREDERTRKEFLDIIALGKNI